MENVQNKHIFVIFICKSTALYTGKDIGVIILQLVNILLTVLHNFL